ncbi:glycosyltransferase family 4 protein [Comamonas testosteroni]|uniref:glycosyltransferase family 4 protein n=1 Tax=Comamonas testosteroni TaxID=285 RepID=UPI0039194D03
MDNEKKINVLYIDGDGPLGGASRSLYELISAFEPETVQPYFFSSNGTASIFYKRIAFDNVSVRGMPKFDHTRYGYYRGWRWLILLREIYNFPFMMVGLLSSVRRWKNIDVIHLNEFVYILPALIAKKILSVPLIVHVRALTKGRDPSIRTSIFNWLLVNFADAVVAIDGNVRGTLPRKLDVEVINNSFSPGQEKVDERLIEIFRKIPKDSFKVGFVGNLHKSKGVMEILLAAKIISQKNFKVHFVIAGGETLDLKGFKGWLLAKFGLAQNIQKEIIDFVSDNDLSDCVSLTGFTIGIGEVYKNIDVLLFPSHFDAPGRPVFEAGFYSKPSIICAKNTTPDTFVNGITGISVPEKSPSDLAEAILFLMNNRDVCSNMGVEAKKLAEENFHPKKNSRKILEIYKRVISSYRKVI